MKPFARLALLVLTSLVAACDTPDSRLPNFVLVLADDLGYGDLGVYGSREIQTPRLDRAAAEGLRFTSFYAEPLCGASRAAFMTGSHPMRIAEVDGRREIHPVLHDREITLAEVLKARGYATACFGKWDLAGHSNHDFSPQLLPQYQGFDVHFGTPTSNDSVQDTVLLRNGQVVEKPADQKSLTRRYTDEAIAFMRDHAHEPFFVYLPYNMPHAPVAASEPFRGRSRRGAYGDAVQEIDWSFGRVLDALESMDLANETYVIFASDNGPWRIKLRLGGTTGPFRGGKVTTWEGGMRVPMIVWGPGRVPANETWDGIATAMDLLPTVAALADAELPRDRTLDGVDLSDVWQGSGDRDDDRSIAYYLWNHLQAVRSGRWKLHLPRPARPPWLGGLVGINHVREEDYITVLRPMLYDLESDPGERSNVARQHPEVVERLLALAEEAREELGDYDRSGSGQRSF
jgi:arylsulfatase